MAKTARPRRQGPRPRSPRPVSPPTAVITLRLPLTVIRKLDDLVTRMPTTLRRSRARAVIQALQHYDDWLPRLTVNEGDPLPAPGTVVASNTNPVRYYTITRIDTYKGQPRLYGRRMDSYGQVYGNAIRLLRGPYQELSKEEAVGVFTMSSEMIANRVEELVNEAREVVLRDQERFRNGDKQ